MATRRILKWRELEGIDLESARLVAHQPITVGEGRVIAAGTDVSEVARKWPTLRAHLKRGVIVAKPKDVAPNPPDDDGDVPPGNDVRPSNARGRRKAA